MAAPFVSSCLCVSVLSQIEIHFDIQRNVDGNSAFHPRPEMPLFERLNRVFVEAESEASDHAQNIDGTIAPNNGFENNRALIAGFPRFFRILGFDTRQDSRRADTATNAE